MSVELARPAALALLAAIPLLLWLERLARRPRRFTVPSTMLFEQLPAADVEAAAARERRRRWIVLLECAAVAAAALGAAGPRWGGAVGSGGAEPEAALEVVVDRSASMAASGLFAPAAFGRNPAVREVAKLPAGARVQLTFTPAEPAPAIRVLDRDAASGVLSTITAVDAPDALELVLARPPAAPRRFVVTDRGLPPVPNLGLTAVREAPGGDALFVRVGNGGPTARAARVTVAAGDGAALAEATLTVPPLAERAALLRSEALAGAPAVRVRVSPADGGEDHLAADDAVRCERAPARAVRAVVAGEPSPSFRRALRAAATGLGLDLRLEERADLPARGEPLPDLLVVSETAPADGVLPDVPVLIEVRAGDHPGASPVEGPVVATAAPILPEVDLTGVRVRRASEAPGAGGDLAPLLARKDGRPLAAVRPTARGAYVWIGFPVEDPLVTDWPLHPSFPVLVAGCLRLATESAGGRLTPIEGLLAVRETIPQSAPPPPAAVAPRVTAAAAPGPEPKSGLALLLLGAALALASGLVRILLGERRETRLALTQRV